MPDTYAEPYSRVSELLTAIAMEHLSDRSTDVRFNLVNALNNIDTLTYETLCTFYNHTLLTVFVCVV